MSATEQGSPPRPRWGLRVALLLAVGGLGLTVCALADGSADEDVEEEASDVPEYREGRIRFSPAFFERAGLAVQTVERRSIVPVVEATGKVDFSPRGVAAVGARIFGRVLEVDVIEGDRVEEGQQLARVESAELGEAQAALLTLRAQAELAEADNRRKQILVQEGITSRRSVEVTAKELEVTRAQQRAAAKQVQSMVGGSRQRGRLGEFFLASPISGEIVAVNIYQGQAVEPSHTAFQVADLSELWIELAVFERDLRMVAVGDRVEVQAGGDEETVVPGVVEHVGSVLDPVTRTATVRVVVDNADRRLRVSQSVVARIESQHATVEGVAVPIDAVVLVDGEPTVFVLAEPGVVEPRTVQLGAQDGKGVEITSGLTAGEEIVAKGVFALKSELFR
jgi:membrane fusion protein, heavy metal efflux system